MDIRSASEPFARDFLKGLYDRLVQKIESLQVEHPEGPPANEKVVKSWLNPNWCEKELGPEMEDEIRASLADLLDHADDLIQESVPLELEEWIVFLQGLVRMRACAPTFSFKGLRGTSQERAMMAFLSFYDLVVYGKSGELRDRSRDLFKDALESEDRGLVVYLLKLSYTHISSVLSNLLMCNLLLLMGRTVLLEKVKALSLKKEVETNAE